MCARSAGLLWVAFGWATGTVWATPADPVPDTSQPPLAAQPGLLDALRENLAGSLRLQRDALQAADSGPLARANALAPGTAATPQGSGTLALELRTAARGWNARATLQATDDGAAPLASFQELGWSTALGGWQLGLGRQVVSWDVGYAFRPNDLVQQESRRALVDLAPSGRGVLQAQRFSEDSALSLVAVNPQASADARGPEEPALAARYYRRLGAADGFAFARAGARTGAGLGAALAWVPSEALELHASLRWQQRGDTLAPKEPGSAATLFARTPWQAASSADYGQALLGAQWTHSSNASVLLEAWWDGSAPADAQWQDWRTRNQALAVRAAQGAPAAAVAGNLAWQADAFGASGSLRRANLLLRLAWTHEGWQPALDWLLTPQDGGQVLTLALRHQGDRLALQAGWRAWGGADDALLAQLPQRRQAYAQASWAF